VLCDTTPATSNQSLSPSGHVTDAGGRSGVFPAGLWECGASWHPGLSARRLQSVLNATAWLIYRLGFRDHITDALVSLHWLRVPERAKNKVAVLTYRALYDTAPRYLGQLVRVADIPGRRALRSADTDRPVVPSVRLHTVGNSAFSVAARRSETVCRMTSYLLHSSLPSVAY